MPSGVMKFLVSFFGSRNERLVRGYSRVVEDINDLEPQFQRMSDADLRAVSDKLRGRLAKGESIGSILPEAFAAVREASDRHLGIRHTFMDEYGFDPSALGPQARTVYDSIKSQFKTEGADVNAIEIPVEYNSEIRRLYPESRPPFRFRHFDVQCIGGQVLFDGKITEMATGEGKTLVATLATYLMSLTGKHVHVVTVNDFLASRDAAWMGPVYRALGFTVGCIQADMDTSGAERRAMYECNITYGTNNEFGFDYLRDNMKVSLEEMVQGPLDYAIVDEVDSILIDEARTPLIISGPAFDDVSRYKKADAVARRLMTLQSTYDSLKKRVDAAEKTMAAAQGELSEAKREKDQARIQELEKTIVRSGEEVDSGKEQLAKMTQYYEVELDRKSVHLTHEGVTAAQEAAGVGSFFTGSNMEWPHMLEQSLRAHVVYHAEVDYVVKEGIVIIVDEFTGRLMHGRQWSDGLHQAVEAKEGVQVKEETQTMATITLQNFFKLYSKKAGMTGTAATEGEEFMKIYGLDVVTIPTNRPCIRDDRQDVIYRTVREKFNAIVDEIFQTSAAGRPVLVGTISIEKSEALSQALTRKYGLEHEVLNAKQHERESHIVAKAGQQHQSRDGSMRGNVTIATNMAGRGTDIVLGPGVANLGGLHVLGTERHEARRIDNQLRGRSGRQGDAGSSQFFLSLDDELIRLFAAEWTLKMLKGLAWEEGQPIYAKMLTRGIERAQKKVEERNFEVRKSLLDYDEVMDHQRKIFYSRRRSILKGTHLKAIIQDMMAGTVERAMASMLAESYPQACIAEWARTRFGVDLKSSRLTGMEPEEIEERVKSEAIKAAENNINLSLGEYLEDYEDPSTWDVQGLSKWALTTFNVNLSVSRLKTMQAEEIEKTLAEAATESLKTRDCSELSRFLEPDYGLRMYVEWARAKFDVQLNVADLRDKGAQQVRQHLLDAIDAKYTQREIEYPVEFAMTMAFGREEPNVYAFQALADWANKKYHAGMTVEDVQNNAPAKTHARLLELSTKYHDGQLEAEIDQAMISSSPDSLAEWAKERFEARVEPSELADKAKARAVLLDSGREFLRRELSDLEKYVLVQTYDSTWKDHLYSMDHLKESIFLRAMAERDPKVEYKHEGFRMFTEMLGSIEERVTDIIFKVRLEGGARARSIWNVSQTQHAQVGQFAVSEAQRAAAQAPQGEAAKPQTIRVETPKVGRNDPCPCGSGKKYKKCHGVGK
jgi:preprotein translocase subunit SecA